MAYVRRNAAPIAIGIVVGYLALPYLVNLVKNR